MLDASARPAADVFRAGLAWAPRRCAGRERQRRRVRRVNRCRVSFSLGDSQEPHRIIAGHRLVRSVPTRPECRRTLIGQHTPPRRESLAARASCDWDYSALQHSVTPAGTGSVLPPSDGGGRSERGSGDPRRTTGGDLWGLCTIRG